MLRREVSRGFQSFALASFPQSKLIAVHIHTNSVKVLAMSSGVKRVRLKFAPGLEVEFVDRDRAVEQVYEFAEKGTRTPVVVFGPEGCGKTAWFKQAAEILREQGFDVMYINVLQREHTVYTDVKEVIDRIAGAVADITSYAPIKLADLIVLLANQLLKKWRKKKIALLMDEVFQTIGIDKAEAYTKMLLNLIEYPPESYENIVIIVATSEGLSRWRIGRHRWGWLIPMWNMPKKGFEELYKRIPGSKPSFEEVWRLTGGNPYIFSQLYAISWRVDKAIDTLIDEKSISPSLINKWREWLEKAVEDPDALWSPDAPQDLINELIARNLIVYFLRDRNPELWIDVPPPDKDPEIGIGRYVAWQTPLHREAVKKAIKRYRS
jgi:hypothetical protein